MGILDGSFKRTFGRTFRNIYLDGTYHEAVLFRKADHTYGNSPVDHPIDVQRRDWSDRYRAEMGIPQTDVRLFVLQWNNTDNVAHTFQIDNDSQITFQGVVYDLIGPSRQDSASAYWDLRVRPRRTP